MPGLDIAHVVFTVEGVGWANPDIIPLMIGNMLIGAWDRGTSNQSANFISPSNTLAAACLNEGLCYSYQVIKRMGNAKIRGQIEHLFMHTLC